MNDKKMTEWTETDCHEIAAIVGLEDELDGEADRQGGIEGLDALREAAALLFAQGICVEMTEELAPKAWREDGKYHGDWLQNGRRGGETLTELANISIAEYFEEFSGRGVGHPVSERVNSVAKARRVLKRLAEKWDTDYYVDNKGNLAV